MSMIIHPEVLEALASKRAVVALESTVIAHGLPFPENLAITQELLQSVRQEGAIPAIIALKDGFVRVGLDDEDLESLASPATQARKVSRRDIAYTLAKKVWGATTVSATMMISHLAGIKIFATGGIGGVHRGGEQSMDISADLHELSQTPVAVVCAGAKSILDLKRTLEVLETLGVPIWGFRTECLPEFFCAGKHHVLDMSFSREEDLVKALDIHLTLGFKSGVIVAQGLSPAYALDNTFVENIIQQAVERASQNNIHGKNLTPFLLQEIAQKSQGQSLRSNKALLLENARLAARIAVIQCYNKS